MKVPKHGQLEWSVRPVKAYLSRALTCVTAKYKTKFWKKESRWLIWLISINVLNKLLPKRTIQDKKPQNFLHLYSALLTPKQSIYFSLCHFLPIQIPVVKDAMVHDCQWYLVIENANYFAVSLICSHFEQICSVLGLWNKRHVLIPLSLNCNIPMPQFITIQLESYTEYFTEIRSWNSATQNWLFYIDLCHLINFTITLQNL